MTTKRRALTPTEKNWAANLQRIWLAKKKPLELNQLKAGVKLGWSQGAVGQYINGIIPLNTDAKLKFARLLRVDVTEIDPSFSSADARRTIEDASAPYVVNARIPLLQWSDAAAARSPETEARAIEWRSEANAGERSFALTVPGESMASGPIPIAEGSIITVDPDVDFRKLPVANPIFVVALLPDQNVVLRQIARDGTQIYLKASAPGYPVAPFTNDCKIIGVVRRITFDL